MSDALPTKLLELKASGITDKDGNAISVGDDIDTWSDSSSSAFATAICSTCSSQVATYPSPKLIEYTNSQGSVHKVARFGCSANCASASPTWNQPTPMQFHTSAGGNNYLYSTQTDGLELWAVLRQPDTGDASHDTASTALVFDIG